MESEIIQNRRTPIQEFYVGTHIFITGATGFVGQVLIEKLLRSCPDLAKMYLLIRPKKGVDGTTRLNSIFQDVVFERLRTEMPDFRQKVVPISGDCEEKNLGMSEDDINTIINEVNIIFHLAATVNFDEKLQKATHINVRATRDMIAMVKKMKKLKFITHVSTAYSHCYLRSLKEEFYEQTGTANNLIMLAENLPSETMEKITDVLLDKYPNTYTMTKSTGEELVMDARDLPIAMYRPAIIVSTYMEPIPGWINNFYGPQGVTTGAMVGLLRSLHCDENVNANIVPVDMCVNALIAIPWDARQKYDDVIEQNKISTKDNKQSYEIPVYNFDSYSYNPLCWKRFRHLTHINGYNLKTMRAMGIYFFHLNRYKFVHNLYTIFLHLLPAVIIDTFLRCTGKKPMLYKAYEKIHRFADIISYFSTGNFTFKSRRLDELCSKMSEEDYKLFFCNLRELDWGDFFKNYLQGCRVFLLKDPLETLPEGEALYYRIKWYTTGSLIILSLLLLSFARFLYTLFI